MSALAGPARERKAALLAAARRLCGAYPDGWGLNDFHRELGVSPDDKRPQRFLQTATGSVLRRLRHGVYAAGPALLQARVAPLGVGVELVAEVDAVMRQHGGVMRLRDLLVQLGRDEHGERLVRQLLQDSPKYISGSPWEGFRQCWRLTEQARQQVPLPGALLRFEVLSTLAGMPETRRQTWDIVVPLHKLRTRIGIALVDARDLAGVTHLRLAQAPGVVPALAAALAHAEHGWERPNGDPSTLGVWWAETLDDAEGDQVEAAATALAELETSEQLLVVQAMTVQAWDAVAAALGVSAALLSRGAVGRAIGGVSHSEQPIALP